MVNRILLGNHPTFGMGGFVSQPGVDVLTANKFQFSWSTIFEQFQILQSGSFVVTHGGGNTDGAFVGFSWANLGYYPLIFLSNDKYKLRLQYLSTSSGQVCVRYSGTTIGMPTGDATVYYIVTRSIKP
ncbi:hypothetical protein SAMN04515648_4563 [Phyllobacterium sp. CL33Tsu]|uniref:hypothetical protein n=1 Tax=Phyllobacterium sp. CL33Tsu TaxID=1798191 RepID=UPI0008DF7053|nr:hypothetical protein [Phyllobacterium sp. CL33Tsu]SFJ55173.1 hypothetical protein SAMN04515648_4563 [Phyllobacterium sp. CL33Tsu]